MNKKKIGAILLLIASVGCIAYAGSHLYSYYSATKQEKALEEVLGEIAKESRLSDNKTSEKAQTSINTDSGKDGAKEAAGEGLTEEARQSLKQMNEDYVAWIDIPGTDISYPVVQRDNSFYLNHDFEQKKSGHGSIFLDESCRLDSEFVMIHGHHMKDKTMFGALSQYKKEEYAKEHDVVLLDAGKGYQEYQVFAAFVIDFTKETQENGVFHYEELPQTADEATEYRNQLLKNAFDKKEELADKNLPILLLSTCDYRSEEARLVIACYQKSIE